MLDTILNINNESIKIFILSMLPITEQRLSIPYYILLENIYWLKVTILSMAGNITIGLFLYFLIGPLLDFLSHFKVLKKLIDLFIQYIRKRTEKINKGNKILGLIIFIGIPLPFTGVWTGILGSYLFNMNRKSMLIALFIGVISSALIVTSLTLAGNEVWLNFIKNEINIKLD